MRRRTIIALAAAICALAGPGVSQVLEIGDDGTVTTYAAPSIHTSQGVTPILPPLATTDTPTSQEIAAAIQAASARHAVPQSVVEAVAWQESRFNQAAVSPKGARGIMQLMPGTASVLGVDAGDMSSNIDGGTAYLGQQLRRFGDLRLALAAYNAGPEAVQRYGGVPPFAETQSYVRAILARLAQREPKISLEARR